MVTTELLAYISREIKRGTNKDDISKSLKSNGWGDNDLKEAFALSPVPKGAPPVTPINPPAKDSPRSITGIKIIKTCFIFLFCHPEGITRRISKLV